MNKKLYDQRENYPKIRCDFSRNKGKTVTVERFNLTATKLLVTKGKSLGATDSIGLDLSQELR